MLNRPAHDNTNSVTNELRHGGLGGPNRRENSQNIGGSDLADKTRLKVRKGIEPEGAIPRVEGMRTRPALGSARNDAASSIGEGWWRATGLRGMLATLGEQKILERDLSGSGNVDHRIGADADSKESDPY